MSATTAPETPVTTAIVEARGLVKRFPGVVALSDVTFAMNAGEVHCLVGENGAGKSTLIKILSGYYAPDEGDVLVAGEPLSASTAAARSAGVATIHQEHNLIPHLSVAENVVLGGWPGAWGTVSPRQVRTRARAALDRVAPGLPLNRPGRMLSAAEGQLVEVARALAQDARVLIMDEPTTALTDSDVDRLFTLVRQLQAEGLAILYVSHKMEEIFALGDRITVLRDGRTVTSGPAGDFTQLSLVKAMVGEDVDLYDHTSNRRDEVALEVRDVSRAGALAGINFTLQAGEILGLGGLVGSGRSELALAIFGADPIDGGEIRVAGKPVSLRSPVDAIAAGIGLVPEERKQQGIVDVLTVRENTTISILDRLTRGGLLDLRKERSVARDYVRDLQVKTPTTETRIGGLSGGNQQKVVIARWLARQPRVLILDEPTKGIDIGAKAEIHRLIQRLAESGVAVLLISSELPELLALSDRVAVMREGRLVAILDRDDATKEAILGAAAAD